jgi:hypothetical protein
VGQCYSVSPGFRRDLRRFPDPMNAQAYHRLVKLGFRLDYRILMERWRAVTSGEMLEEFANS